MTSPKALAETPVRSLSTVAKNLTFVFTLGQYEAGVLIPVSREQNLGDEQVPRSPLLGPWALGSSSQLSGNHPGAGWVP